MWERNSIFLMDLYHKRAYAFDCHTLAEIRARNECSMANGGSCPTAQESIAPDMAV